MQSPLRIGMIGAGGVSRSHANVFPYFRDRISLAAVCGRNLAAARLLASEHGTDIPVFSDPLQLLGFKQLNAVIIALPHFLHHPVASAFLEAGVHVLVEKPITCTADELRDLHTIASRNGLILMAGQMRRFGPAVMEVKTWCESSSTHFGELRSFDAVVQVNVHAYTGGRNDHWALDGAKAGGGVITTFGIHRLDMIRHLTGEDFASVSALGRFDYPFSHGAESQANVLFRMSNGATGTLHANALAPRTPYMDGFCLHGSHGSIIEVGGPMRYATTTGVVTREWGHQHQGFMEANDSHDPGDDVFARQLIAFADAIDRNMAAPFNTPEGNFNTIACLDAIAESIAIERPVAVATL